MGARTTFKQLFEARQHFHAEYNIVLDRPMDLTSLHNNIVTAKKPPSDVAMALNAINEYRHKFPNVEFKLKNQATRNSGTILVCTVKMTSDSLRHLWYAWLELNFGGTIERAREIWDLDLKTPSGKAFLIDVSEHTPISIPALKTHVHFLKRFKDKNETK